MKEGESTGASTTTAMVTAPLLHGNKDTFQRGIHSVAPFSIWESGGTPSTKKWLLILNNQQRHNALMVAMQVSSRS